MLTKERKDELRKFADGIGADSWIGATVVELLDSLDRSEARASKLDLDILETRGNFDGAQDRIAALEADLAEAHGQVGALQVKLEGYRIDAADKDKRIAAMQLDLDKRDRRIDEVATEAQDARQGLRIVEEQARAVILRWVAIGSPGDDLRLIRAIAKLRVSLGMYLTVNQTAAKPEPAGGS